MTKFNISNSKIEQLSAAGDNYKTNMAVNSPETALENHKATEVSRLNEDQQPRFSRDELIRTVQTPLGFFVLAMLVVEAMLAAAAGLTSGLDRTLTICGMLILVASLIGIVAFLAYYRPEALRGERLFHHEAADRTRALSAVQSGKLLIPGWVENKSLGELVPTDAKRVVLIGQNLASRLGSTDTAHRQFHSDLRPILERGAEVLLVMMTSNALRAIHPEAADDLERSTLPALERLSELLGTLGKQVRVIFHPAATLSALVIDRRIAYVTPKFQRTYSISRRLTIELESNLFDWDAFDRLVDYEPQKGEFGAECVQLSESSNALRARITMQRMGGDNNVLSPTKLQGASVDSAERTQLDALGAHDQAAFAMTDEERTLLLSYSRPRNEQGIWTSFFEDHPTRENAKYPIMLEKFARLNLMRFIGDAYLMTPFGYEVTDRLWSVLAMRSIERVQTKERPYVEFEAIAKDTKLIDDEAELKLLQRLLTEQAQAGHLDLVPVDGGIAAAQVTAKGIGYLRLYAQINIASKD